MGLFKFTKARAKFIRMYSIIVCILLPIALFIPTAIWEYTLNWPDLVKTILFYLFIVASFYNLPSLLIFGIWIIVGHLAVVPLPELILIFIFNSIIYFVAGFLLSWPLNLIKGKNKPV